MANFKAPCEWCEFRWVFKNGLLPNSPKWTDSEIFLFFWPAVLALPSTGRQKNKFWDTLVCPIGPKKKFGPIPGQAAEIIGGLLSTESQSDRVTESRTRVPSTQVSEIFLCLISINSPTRFARRGIIFHRQLKFYFTSITFSPLFWTGAWLVFKC